MSKVIALDFGLKRTGLALSDDSKTFAFGLKTVDSKLLLSELKAIVIKEKVDEILLGEPKRMNGEDSHISENIRLLHQTLVNEFPLLKVILRDERFTSKMAAHTIALSGLKKKDREQKGLVDEVSATIILQDYLHSR